VRYTWWFVLEIYWKEQKILWK